jgi:hypothetical protein
LLQDSCLAVHLFGDKMWVTSVKTVSPPELNFITTQDHTRFNRAGSLTLPGNLCGQLAGAFWGESGIPTEWREGLARREMIEDALAGLGAGKR